MKLAIPQLDGRISPVFDTATSLLLVEVLPSGERNEITHSLIGLTPMTKVDFADKLGIEVLLCAGISRPLLRCLEGAGIVVIDCVIGEIPAVIEAYMAGDIGKPSFQMPGFRGRSGRNFRGQGQSGRGQGGRGDRGRGGGRCRQDQPFSEE